jgi:plastocyanin
LTFDQDEYTVAAGCLELTFGGDASHTLVFDGTSPFPKFTGLGTESYEIKPGEYTIYCDVGTHRAGGMEATLIVTGDPGAAGEPAPE